MILRHSAQEFGGPMTKIILLPAFLCLVILSLAAAQDWPMVNHDITMSRNSPQTDIGKDNVAQLQAVWVLNTGYPIENSPLIAGDIGYVQNNAMIVHAFDLKTGLSVWKYDPKVGPSGQIPRATNAHGMAYDNGIIYADTGPNATVVALDAKTGKKMWESQNLIPADDQARGSYRIQSPVAIWKNMIIVGNSLGDEPPFGYPARGFLTALDKSTGKQLWLTRTAVGDWVNPNNNASINNGGATPWTVGSIDNDKGIIYVPCGNAAPDFTASTRPLPNNYTYNIIAVNLADGKILWATPMIAPGSVFAKALNLTIPDTHDWDPDWGTNLVMTSINGTMQKIVIGHDKHGDIMAMNATTGKPIWWNVLGVRYNDWAQPSQNGTVIWPATQNGIESFTAFDENNVYAAVSNTGVYYFSGPGLEGRTAPAFDMMPNGLGNGSIVALDLKTGKVKWEQKFDFPVWGAPIVTNGLIFCDHVTASGTPYTYTVFGQASDTPQIPSGIMMALDKDTGKVLWQFNVGAPVGVGGAAIGNGMLLVPTGSPAEIASNSGGYVVGFALPSANKTG
jgi:alcohol dehydrogenase (cytochrome c)